MTTQSPLKSISQIKKEQQQRINNLMDECCVFWAFSNEQFADGKSKYPIPEGEKYVSIGAGGFCPKSKSQQLFDGFKSINKWYKAELKANKARKQNIAYELANHEAYYTGCIEDTLNALGEDYTPEEVNAVYNEERKKH